MTRYITKETYAAYLRSFEIKQPRQPHRQFTYPDRFDDIRLGDEQVEVLPLTDRSGSEGVLIGVVDELVYASRYSVGARSVDKTGRSKPAICDLCKTQQEAGGVRLVSFPKPDADSEHDSNGYLCCADLACSLHVRDLTPESLRSRTVLRETEFVDGVQKPLTTERRIARLKNNLTVLFEHLGVEPQLLGESE